MFVGATRCHAWSAERNTFVSAFSTSVRDAPRLNAA
jgi:hypothetical protein